MKHFRACILTAILLFGATACETQEVIPSNNSDDQSEKNMENNEDGLFDSEWILTDYKNDHLASDLRNKAYLTMERGSGTVHLLSGRSFINGYSGHFKLDEKKMTITSVDNIISTLMGGTPEQNAAEKQYFAHLMKATSYRLIGDSLIVNFGNHESGFFVRK